MESRRWILIPPAIWITCLLTVHILGAFMAPDTSEIPSECPENSNNCERLMMAANASPEALHSAAMEWISTQSRTSIESEEATSSHTVFHSRWFMFPDDFFVETGCTENGTWIQIHSESRLGWGDMGVNQERIDQLVEYLIGTPFETSEC